jgi:ABC-type branched-subunit amino acid transport system ATPase component
MRVCNLGCIGPEGCEVALDKILCLVGGNNTGKSTILRAYELALGATSFDPAKDLCRRAGDAPSAVEIWVHIPEGMANIAEKWKMTEGALRLVRSKWEWSKETNWTKTRTTWNPETSEYSTDDKASGLDTVFNSRLPIPFRIGSLENPDAEHRQLLTIVLQPIADKIEKIMGDSDSDLRKIIASVGILAKRPVDEERERLDELKADLNRSHNAIFPDLKLDFDIGIGEVEINPLQMLLKNSRLKFMDGLDEVSWTQQGTGSQRALFWTMLQVRSRLKAIADIAEQNRKGIVDLQKRVKKLLGEAEKAKKEETKQGRLAEIVEIEKQIAEILHAKPEELLAQQSQTLSLPGYMLLIDEPEIALHPNAIRAASRYLYNLTEDRTWQVMLATHSPLFIDPLHDHTTVVRLTRCQANPTPKTYRSDAVTFSPDDKENLKILNRFDLGLAEMFFGQLPVLIEGDTEYAAFELLINKYPDQFPISRKPVLVRARGKFTMLLIMRILSEFRVPFAILHDADTPFRRDGSMNGAWTANKDIFDAIQTIRARGVRVVHRISLPDFEYANLPLQYTKDGNLIETNSKDKPWRTIQAIKQDVRVETSILSVLTDLTSSESEETLFRDDFLNVLMTEIQKWGNQYCQKDLRFGLK